MNLKKITRFPGYQRVGWLYHRFMVFSQSQIPKYFMLRDGIYIWTYGLFNKPYINQQP